MRILWIINSPFPEVYKELNMEGPVTVGWVYAAAKQFIESNRNADFAVASLYIGKELMHLKKGEMSHFLLPKESDSKLIESWRKIKSDFDPDLIHIHGTEYPHSFLYVKACGPDKVVVSIQGMVSVIERYYLGGISSSKLIKSITFRDLVRFDTLFLQKKNIRRRGGYEKRLLQNVQHVIGRTSWDKTHTWAINPAIHYHFCNETLRPSFYDNKWSLGACEKYSIFISQAHYPLKGFHQLVKALPLILMQYPEAKVYVAGNDFFSKKWYRISGYGKYINRLINKLGLSAYIKFTGLLNEKEMCDRFVKSHVFVSPSSIENSPNSVGEAQLLGVPCVASYVGGTMDMVEHGKTGLLYRFEELEMLASNICRLFSDSQLAIQLSDGGKRVARERHDKGNNAKRLLEVYNNVL